MAMAGLQRQATKIVQKILVPMSSRAHHSVAEIPQHHSCMGIPIPRFLAQSGNFVNAPRVDNSVDSNSLFRNPFMDLMAVPKRKVTPSRKGKRNGPKAYKPVTVIAKCKGNYLTGKIVEEKAAGDDRLPDCNVEVVEVMAL